MKFATYGGVSLLPNLFVFVGATASFLTLCLSRLSELSLRPLGNSVRGNGLQGFMGDRVDTIAGILSTAAVIPLREWSRPTQFSLPNTASVASRLPGSRPPTGPCNVSPALTFMSCSRTRSTRGVSRRGPDDTRRPDHYPGFWQRCLSLR